VGSPSSLYTSPAGAVACTTSVYGTPRAMTVAYFCHVRPCAAAGGVAIGSLARLHLSPGGAVACTTSVCGITWPIITLLRSVAYFCHVWPYAAGGVAMGSSASLHLSPGGAVAVGLFAGLLSTTGFGWLVSGQVVISLSYA
jgi:hypothetical protein